MKELGKKVLIGIGRFLVSLDKPKKESIGISVFKGGTEINYLVQEDGTFLVRTYDTNGDLIEEHIEEA